MARMLDCVFCGAMQFQGTQNIPIPEYEVLEEAESALDRIMDLIKTRANDCEECGAAAIEAVTEYERQGFINGLRMGVKLARELFGTGPQEED